MNPACCNVAAAIVTPDRRVPINHRQEFVRKPNLVGVNPIVSHQQPAFSYVSVRSRDAGKGTTTLAFRLDVRQPSTQDCSTGNDPYTVSF